MSKLIERLEKVDAAATPPLGFGASRTQTKPASMLLVASSRTPSSTDAAGRSSRLTCVSCPRLPSARRRSRQPRTPWVMSLWGALARCSLQGVRGRPQGAGRRLLSSSLRRTHPRRSLCAGGVGTPDSDSGGLPGGAGTVPGGAARRRCDPDRTGGGGAPLSVKNLMQVRSIRDLISKPLLLLRSRPLSQGELTVLQDTGIQAIVLDSRPMSMRRTR